MKGMISPKIIGACIVGIGLVSGAYVLSNLQKPSPANTQLATVLQPEIKRSAIAVEDRDNNGIEDWRDRFVETNPVLVDIQNETAEEYVEPTTVTGKLGVDFFEQFLLSKTYGDLGRTQDQLISDTITTLAEETAFTLYDTPDITIMREWEPEDIRTYANTIALNITNNNISDIESEMFILNDILKNDKTDRVSELESIAEAYKNMRDQTLATPVPANLTKEHLDLINTYQAIYYDVSAMAMAIDDPAFSFMRMKRYEDDALALKYSLTNMYKALLPFASLVQPEDPALIFAVFSPEYKL